MKITSLILCGTFISLVGFGQIDAVVGVAGKSLPQLVTMPSVEANAAVIADMQTQMAATQARMELEANELKRLMTLATWANNLVTVQRLINMIENTICFSGNLNAKVGFYSGNCLYQFNWNMQLVRMNCAIDQLSLVIANGIEMTTGERLAGIDRAVQQFHQAQTGLQNLSGVIDRRLMATAKKAQNQKTTKYLITLRR